MDDRETPLLKFSVPLVRTVALLLGTITAAMGIAVFVAGIYELKAGRSASIWAPVLGLVAPCCLGALVLLRVGLLAAAEVSDAEITVRPPLRSRRVPMVDVAGVEIGAGSSLTLPWKVPAVRLRDGRMIKVENLRVLGHVIGTPVDAFTTAVRERISLVA